MSNRKALRDLSQKFPARPEIEKILNELRDKDDLHTAIMAVSIVEATLERLIISRLRKSNKDLLNDLFQFRGPLGDFNSKILIAEAFGIITDPLAHELHSMRAIRNAFAHAKMPISFTDKPVKQEVESLRILGPMRATSAPFKLQLDSKNWFLFAIRMVLIMLEQIAAMTGTADQVIEEALRDTT